MGESIVYQRPDGSECPGYWATPEGGADAPGIVLMHEWWGLVHWVKLMTDRYAQAGYLVLAPDLYRGRVAIRPEDGEQLMGSLVTEEVVQEDICGALKRVRDSSNGSVSLVGYCMGGGFTIAAAAELSEMDSSVSYYPLRPDRFENAGDISVPLQAHFAKDDPWVTDEAVATLNSRLKEGGVAYTRYHYDAPHAFCNDDRPELYTADAATTSWERTLSFLKSPN